MISKTKIFPETIKFAENESFIYGRKKFQTFFSFFCSNYKFVAISPELY